MAVPATLSVDFLKFAAGVRLHWSVVRQQHWLLFPEGAVALNASAAAILTCCNGQHRLDEMISVLQTQFQNVNVCEIKALLARLIDQGLLVQSLQP
jgi:pyrroloquinoline quinone biosynthesis protein D